MITELTFHCCKHLDHDESHYHQCYLRADMDDGYAYFERSDNYCHDEIRKYVQFCSGRGRLNQPDACIMGNNVCSDYEDEIRTLTIADK